MNKHIFTLLFFVCIAPVQQAFSSGGMAANFGTFTTGVSDGGAKRYNVELDETGQLLRGKVNGEIIELIIIDAPGTDVRKILIREIKDSSGGGALLITAQGDLLDKFNRATVYLKPAYSTLKLIENVDGSWEPRNPVSVPVGWNSADQKSQNYIVAFRLTSLGEKILVEDESPFIKGKDGFSDISAGSSSRRNITSALWPWIMSGVVLIMAWIVSRWMHVLDWRGSR